MKHFFTILGLFFISNIVGQEIQGRYEGAVSRDGSIQIVNIDFFIEEGIQKAVYEIPELGSYKVPVDSIFFRGDTLNLKFYYGNFLSFYDKEKKEITGISEKWNPKIRLHLKLKDFIPSETFYASEEVKFSNNEIVLSGMIFKPIGYENNSSNYIVLVHGSGAQDRYSPYYISLGHKLAKSGIGVLLFDKRGTGKSTGDFHTSNFENLARDAAKAADYLKGRQDLNIKKIGLLGTSQGGWILPIASNLSNNINFLILNVGPAVSVFEQDIHRVKYSLVADGWNEATVDSAVFYTEAYFAYAQSNDKKDWKLLERLIPKAKNAEYSYVINIPKDKNDFNWWRNNSFDPKKSLENLNIPVLSLFGELDPLVPPFENEAKMKDYLSKAGVYFKVVTIPGVAHDMKTFQGLTGNQWDWPKSYWVWRSEPPQFMEEILEFIKIQ